jgi:hypothetical protein
MQNFQIKYKKYLTSECEILAFRSNCLNGRDSKPIPQNYLLSIANASRAKNK